MVTVTTFHMVIAKPLAASSTPAASAPAGEAPGARPMPT
jgi:hypothetical protein